jgi:hypothetical protein
MQKRKFLPIKKLFWKRVSMACRIENVKTLWVSPNRYSSTNLHFLHKTAVDHQLELVNVYFSNATFSSPTSPSQMIKIANIGGH